MNNPLTVIIFGATGDLYQNKLSTAFFNLFSLGLLPPKFRIIGFGRKPFLNSDFQSFTRAAITSRLHLASTDRGKDPKNKKNLEKFLTHFEYMQGNLENLESFENLSKKLAANDRKIGFCTDKLFYLAVPPLLYGIIFRNVAKAGLTVSCAPLVENRVSAWTRVLVEKPFGKDAKEAERLDKILGELFDESQVFRIDHYLAKEAMQNILAFRFENKIFEPLWSNKNIERMRIVIHEEGALQTRGAFYDGIGALRDMGQNHMLQMLALIAMENPRGWSAERIQNARKKVLERTFLSGREKLLRGQYDGYLNEPNVKADSKTETFFRATLGINNRRWKGVSFEMENGRALSRSEVFIEVHFKKAPAYLKFPISSDNKKLFDAYEKVLHDCILGDRTIFVSAGEIVAEWRLVADIIKKWRKTPLVIYKKGSKGEDIGKKCL